MASWSSNLPKSSRVPQFDPHHTSRIKWYIFRPCHLVAKLELHRWRNSFNRKSSATKICQKFFIENYFPRFQFSMRPINFGIFVKTVKVSSPTPILVSGCCCCCCCCCCCWSPDTASHLEMRGEGGGGWLDKDRQWKEKWPGSSYQKNVFSPNPNFGFEIKFRIVNIRCKARAAMV